MVLSRRGDVASKLIRVTICSWPTSRGSTRDEAGAKRLGAFGTGPRVCLGQHLATTEMTVSAAMLLQRFALGVPDAMAPPWPTFNITLRPACPLRMRFRAASASETQALYESAIHRGCFIALAAQK